MRPLNGWQGLGVAAGVCGVLAAGSVFLAFLGADRAGAVMSCGPLLALTAALLGAVGFSGVRAVVRRRYDSALLHLGCACVLAGWLSGRLAVRAATPERPASGAMVLVDGDVSDKLWEGRALNAFVGKVPFSVRLERFFVERYARDAKDEEAGREAPVREYRSRASILEPGKEPYVVNIRVNRPAYVRGYHIYQMSWGESQDVYGRPVTYTVLQFVRDPGLPVVYAGFALLFAGVFLFAVRVFRSGRPATGEVSP